MRAYHILACVTLNFKQPYNCANCIHIQIAENFQFWNSRKKWLRVRQLKSSIKAALHRTSITGLVKTSTVQGCLHLYLPHYPIQALNPICFLGAQHTMPTTVFQQGPSKQCNLSRTPQVASTASAGLKVTIKKNTQRKSRFVCTPILIWHASAFLVECIPCGMQAKLESPV